MKIAGSRDTNNLHNEVLSAPTSPTDPPSKLSASIGRNPLRGSKCKRLRILIFNPFFHLLGWASFLHEFLLCWFFPPFKFEALSLEFEFCYFAILNRSDLMTKALAKASQKLLFDGPRTWRKMLFWHISVGENIFIWGACAEVTSASALEVFHHAVNLIHFMIKLSTWTFSWFLIWSNTWHNFPSPPSLIHWLSCLISLYSITIIFIVALKHCSSRCPLATERF